MRLAIANDTGAPEGSPVYTTLILLHGGLYHSAIFAKLLPLADKLKARIVLVNRQAYPGTEPYAESDLRLLALGQQNTGEGREAMARFMRDRGGDVHAMLEDWIVSADPPVEGGVVLAGWSYASCWLTALLAYAATFPAGKVDVSRYISRVVAYDPPFHALGYAPPEKNYNPLLDEKIPPAERAHAFNIWVSSYFKHTVDDLNSMTLEYVHPLPEPPSPFATMDSAAFLELVTPEVVAPTGPETLCVLGNITTGATAPLRLRVLHPEPPKEGDGKGAPYNRGWDAVEWRMIWCDCSVWEMPWGAAALVKELADPASAGKKTRKVSVVRWRGANHFPHWEQPEAALRGLLADDPKDVIINKMW